MQWRLSAYCWLSHSLDIVDAGLKRGRSLTDNYMEHYTGEERRLRHSVMRQAEEAVLSPTERPRWSVTTRQDGRSMAKLVHDSPEGLRLALSVLLKRPCRDAPSQPTELSACNVLGQPS